jgi:hypothetical protein
MVITLTGFTCASCASTAASSVAIATGGVITITFNSALSSGVQKTITITGTKTPTTDTCPFGPFVIQAATYNSATVSLTTQIGESMEGRCVAIGSPSNCPT